MKPPDWNTIVDIYPTDWVCPQDSFWVAGWAESPSGLALRDIRARFGDRVFLGLCGLPRSDRPSPHSGYSFYLPPVAGARELVIEICDQHGRWTEVFQQAISGAPPAQAIAQTTPQRPDIDLLLDLLRLRLGRPHQSWRQLTDELLLARRAEFIDIMPSEPFKGALEQLATRVAVHYEHVIITGWVAHRSQRIVRLTAFFDSAAPIHLVHGLDRPDAGELFSEYTDAARSRFAGFLRLPIGMPRPLSLRIFAETEDGQSTLVFLKRIHPIVVSGAGTDLPPPTRRMLWQAARALNRAAWKQSWFSGNWRAFLSQSWQGWLANVPARRLPSPCRDSYAKEYGRVLHLTLVTHNLNFEGAPLFLFEFAQYLHAHKQFEVTLVSASDGPLRQRFEAADIPVFIIKPDVDLATSDDEAFARSLDHMSQNSMWSKSDLILTNTLVAFWAIPLAQRLGKPSVFYIHESAGVRRFFALDYSPAAIARVEHAIAHANRVVFPAADGQRAHAHLNQHNQFRALPGWVDVARIESWRSTQDRDALREPLGLSPDAVVFAHIGSLLARKGVHVYIEAIRSVVRSAPPDVPLVFLVVGAKDGPDPYADVVRHMIANTKDADIRIIPQSADPYRWFYLSDVFVCASLEEVFPRVVLEAAVLGRKIVSTNVNGIPEMLGPSEAWLVPPDDAAALSSGMLSALAACQHGDDSKAKRAQARVMKHFDSARMLPQHTALVLASANL